MPDKRIIFKNIFISLFSNIIDKIFGLIVIAYLARTVGASDFGVWGFAISLTSVLFLIIRLGTDTLILREVPKELKSAQLYFSNIFIIRIISTLFVFIALVFLSSYLNKSNEALEVLYLVFLLSTFASFTDFGNLFFRAFHKMEYEGLVTVIRAILKLTVGISVLFIFRELLPYILSAVIVSGIICSMSFYLVNRKLFTIGWFFDFSYSIRLLKTAFPFLVLGSFVIIYHQIDIIMLSIMKGNEATGWYKSINTLYSIFIFVPVSFVGAILPALSRFYTESPDEFIKTYNEAIKFLYVLVLPIVVGIFLLADKFVPLFFGDQYVAGVLALRIIIWGMIAGFLSPIVGNVLIASHRERIPLYVAAISCMLNILLNLLLIPKYSLYGASAATVITTTFSFFSQLFFVLKRGGEIYFMKIFPMPLLAISLMALTTYLLHNCNLIFNIIVSSTVYMLMLFLLRIITKDEIMLLKSLILIKR